MVLITQTTEIAVAQALRLVNPVRRADGSIGELRLDAGDLAVGCNYHPVRNPGSAVSIGGTRLNGGFGAPSEQIVRRNNLTTPSPSTFDAINSTSEADIVPVLGLRPAPGVAATPPVFIRDGFRGTYTQREHLLIHMLGLEEADVANRTFRRNGFSNSYTLLRDNSGRVILFCSAGVHTASNGVRTQTPAQTYLSRPEIG